MNSKKSLICIVLLGVAVLAVVFALERKSYNGKMLPTFDCTDQMIIEQGYFELVASADENRHLPSDVVSYSFGDGYVHLVLPNAVSAKNVVVYIRNANGDYLARRVYDFTGKVMIGDWEVVLDRPVLPTLYFETDNPEEYINMIGSDTTDLYCHGDMQICVDKSVAKSNGWYEEYMSSEGGNNSGYTATLKGRGSSSWMCDSKKSYSLILEDGMNLLGMGDNKKWNLIGNAYDPSLLKNTTFNNLSDELGIMYQPNMQYINLYIDGTYQGVYLLTTKVSVSKDKINLNKGDYLYKMDAPNCEQPISYESITWFEDGNTAPAADLVYPENASEKKLSEAQEILQRFIDVVENPESDELWDIVDVDSLVKYYWIQEASMNFDAWQRSVYIYYDHNDGLIHFGPVWDMDLTLGSPYEKAGMLFNTPEGYRIRNAGWYLTLFKRDDFVEAVEDAYYNGGIRQELSDTVDGFYTNKEYLGADGYLNYAIYGHANMGPTINYGDSYDEYCDNMVEFYRQRINWIDKQIGEN